MAMIENSAPLGTGNEIRIKPFLSSRRYADTRSSNVATFALGQTAPSTGRKIGSLPRVVRKRTARSGGDTDQPWEGTWHDRQVLPLEPIFLKNGFERSIDPFVEIVVALPLGFSETNGPGNDCDIISEPRTNRARTTANINPHEQELVQPLR